MKRNLHRTHAYAGVRAWERLLRASHIIFGVCLAAGSCHRLLDAQMQQSGRSRHTHASCHR